MPKLTKRIVESVPPPPERDVMVWDNELPGFGVRVWASGKRVYILKYRNKDGRQRKPVIGRHGVITTENARSIARQWLGDVEKGIDPSADNAGARNAPTIKELAERYITEHAQLRKKPRSIKSDETILRLHIFPTLGALKVGAVTRQDIQKLHHKMRATKGAANRTLALLSKMFNLSEKWGLRPDGSNPCRHVEKYPERKIERYLSEVELARLADVLIEAEKIRTEMPSVIAAIRLLLFTGARLGEILTLQWDNVDMEQHCLRLPDSKTGAKTIFLAPAAQEVLANIERKEDNPFVITGAKPGAHLVNLEKPWGRLRAEAGFEDVRLHDLRHSFASMAVASGLSLPMIGALLGHSQPATTARYAHLADDPMKKAAEITGGRIAAAMGENKPKSNVGSG